jgi:hypothetical protein
MALVTNAFHAFQASGNREDLSDVLSVITPKEAPLYDAMGAGTPAKATLHTWQTDTLPGTNSDNAVLEGETWSADATTPTSTLSNYVQISTKQFAVTEIQEVVSHAGRGSEIGYQKAKALASLKRDFEAILFNYGTAASGNAGSTTVARRLRNVHSWCFAVTGNTGYSGVAANTYISASGITGSTITEAVFNLILQDIWDEGGRPNAVYVNGGPKRLISGWGTSSSRVWNGEKKITNTVDVYEGDFSTVELKKDRHVASSLGYILDESLWKKSIMLPVGEVNIGKTGMASPIYLRQAWTIEARNPTGNGAFVTAS